MNSNKLLKMNDTRVELLDDPVKFNNIVTNQKNINALTKKVQSDYMSWYNWLLDHPYKGIVVPIKSKKTDITWVGDHYQDMIDFVKEFYSGIIPKERNGDGVKKYQPNTLKIMLNALSHILLAIDKNKFKEITRPLWNQSLKIAITHEDKNEENQMSKSEQKNWICFADLQKRRDEMIELWNKDKRNIKLESSRKAHMYSLILAVNTLIPPLRLDWIGMKIWNKQEPPPKIGADAYLWQQRKGEWSIVINHDKVTHHSEKIKLGRAVFDISKEIPGVTQGARLNQMISESLRIWPREFVLQSVRNPQMPMEATGYTASLKFMFKPKSPSQNILRKSFVNHYYPLVNTSIKKQIAERMRHSVEVAMRSYIKDCKDGDDVLENVQVVKKEGSTAKLAVKKSTYFDAKAYAKKYREENKEKLKAKRKEKYDQKKKEILRKKQVFSANAGYVKTVKQSTVDKYNLKQDDNGVWS